MYKVVTPRFASHFLTALAVNSGALSERIWFYNQFEKPAKFSFANKIVILPVYIYITHNMCSVNNEERIKLTKTIKGERK